MNKDEMDLIRKTTVEYLDEHIYPKLEQIILRRLDDTLDIKIRNEGQKFFEQKNEQLGNALVEVIKLLALKTAS